FAQTCGASRRSTEVEDETRRFERRPRKLAKELTRDSRTLRRRHHFPGSAQCRQRCAKWAGALPAWAHRRQTARALDAERVRPGEVKSGSIGAVFLRRVSLSTLRRAKRKARLGEPVRGRGSKGANIRWACLSALR